MLTSVITMHGKTLMALLWFKYYHNNIVFINRIIIETTKYYGD